MYLHIGKENIIKENEIIGIFDLEKDNKERYYKEVINKLKKESKIINISKKTEKTLILIEKQKEIWGYITNISSTTLLKRIETKSIK